MVFFVVYQMNGEQQAKMFNTVDQLFQWMGDYLDSFGKYPEGLCVFKGDCIFDAS